VARPPRPSHRREIDDTTTLILRALRRALADGPLSADEAIRLAAGQVLRPLGPRLNDDARAGLQRGLRLLGQRLLPAHKPPEPRALFEFAKEAASLAWQAHKEARSPGAVIREHARNVQQLAAAAVVTEALHANDSEDHIRRAVLRGLREWRRGLPGIPVPLIPGDPLRDLLDLPAQGRVRLPKSDLRGRIARVADRAPAFGDTLRQAAAFSSHLLEDALGPELWALCRPLGYIDQRQKKVLVQCDSPALAQETQLRAQELLWRLKQVPGLAHVTGVKVQSRRGPPRA
jgi:hypothetical protein